jgi:hypothetical protein
MVCVLCFDLHSDHGPVLRLWGLRLCQPPRVPLADPRSPVSISCLRSRRRFLWNTLRGSAPRWPLFRGYRCAEPPATLWCPFRAATRRPEVVRHGPVEFRMHGPRRCRIPPVGSAWGNRRISDVRQTTRLWAALPHFPIESIGIDRYIQGVTLAELLSGCGCLVF